MGRVSDWSQVAGRGRQPAIDPDRIRVMVVDDDVTLLVLLERWLVEAGFEVRVRSTPLGTANAVARFDPDILLIDVHMPGLSGVSLAEIIRRRSKRDVGIILFSGGDAEETRRLARDHAFLGAIPKSLNVPLELGLLVAQWLEGVYRGSNVSAGDGEPAELSSRDRLGLDD